MNDEMEILEALHVRELCKGGLYMTKQQATEQHFDMLAECLLSDERSEKLARERELLELGEQYFAEGYRLHNSARWINGHAHDPMPDDAIASRLVDAGYIATSEAVRRQWVTAPKPRATVQQKIMLTPEQKDWLDENATPNITALLLGLVADKFETFPTERRQPGQRS